MPKLAKTGGGKQKRVTRFAYEELKEPRTPETGHTALLPADEQVVTVPMDNGWSKAIEVGKFGENDEQSVVVDMDPAADPVVFWAGKRNRRRVRILPLQRNEIVSESRIAQIIDRARRAAAEEAPQMSLNVQSSKDIPAALDGEAVNLGRSAEIDFVSRAVNVIVPAK